MVPAHKDKAAYFFGIWDPTICAIDIGEQHGKVLEGMGHRLGKRRVIFPEEAFFLISRGLMGCVDTCGALMHVNEAFQVFSEEVADEYIWTYTKAKAKGFYPRRPRGREMLKPLLANQTFPAYISLELWTELPPSTREPIPQEGNATASQTRAYPLGFPYPYRHPERTPKYVVAVHRATDPFGHGPMSYGREKPLTAHAVVEDDRVSFMEFFPATLNELAGNRKSPFEKLARDIPEGDEERRKALYGEDYDIYGARDTWPPDPSECHPDFPCIPYKHPGEPLYAQGSEKE
eukprot:CAMPEP_0184494840 /NCGR_PEP_ID=MMETSP0113_2-20130426/29705_1 /TAXON_ID=91329 /ORGANISM="Norrisiella sphaerica, Strain BC52" /LENGTH=289 /DNA_ID=CAMNT_0026880747 /DNA_START=56 /DNA_END=922 /DNA_ORIENTATION=+